MKVADIEPGTLSLKLVLLIMNGLL